MFLKMVSSHSHVDHMLVNPVSVVILEWTLCDVMLCVILFLVCTRPVAHLTFASMSHGRARPLGLPANHMVVDCPCGCFCPGGRERQGQGGAGEAERRAL